MLGQGCLADLAGAADKSHFFGEVLFDERFDIAHMAILNYVL